jgi:uncharacterized membrane protein
MIPLDSALKHRREFDERWFLLPVGVVLILVFAVGILVMLPRSAPIFVEAVPAEGATAESAPAAVSVTNQ